METSSQKQSEAARCNQKQSEATRSNQKPSEANRSQQKPTEAMLPHLVGDEQPLTALVELEVARRLATRVEDAREGQHARRRRVSVHAVHGDRVVAAVGRDDKVAGRVDGDAAAPAPREAPLMISNHISNQEQSEGPEPIEARGARRPSGDRPAGHWLRLGCH